MNKQQIEKAINPGNYPSAYNNKDSWFSSSVNQWINFRADIHNLLWGHIRLLSSNTTNRSIKYVGSKTT